MNWTKFFNWLADDLEHTAAAELEQCVFAMIIAAIQRSDRSSALWLTFGGRSRSCGARGPPPGRLSPCRRLAEGLLLAAAQSAQRVGQSRLEQLDLVLLQLQLLLQVGNAVLHVHVTAGWHGVIWRGQREKTWIIPQIQPYKTKPMQIISANYDIHLKAFQPLFHPSD